MLQEKELLDTLKKFERFLDETEGETFPFLVPWHIYNAWNKRCWVWFLSSSYPKPTHTQTPK